MVNVFLGDILSISKLILFPLKTSLIITTSFNKLTDVKFHSKYTNNFYNSNYTEVGKMSLSVMIKILTLIRNYYYYRKT